MGKRKVDVDGSQSEVENVVESVVPSTPGGDDDDTPKTMFGTLYSNKKKASITSLIHSWNKSYLKDKVKATVELINFIIESCGCKTSITVNQFKNDEIENILKRIISPEYIKEGEGDYPIASKKNKKFRATFLDFWNKLISKCSNKILYDGFFMDSLISWISAFTNSSARPFRHTATLAGLEIVGALIKIALRVDKDLDNNRRQLKTEKKKASSSGNSKISSLSENSERLHQNKVDLEQIVDELFKGVFAHRYRDTIPEIRSSCITALGSWMKQYTTHFLEDQYLKYIGWALNDKDGIVRQSALEALDELYGPGLGPLDLFTQRFKNRIVEMAADKDINVGAKAIKVATHLAKYEVLEQEDVEKIYKLITDDNRALRVEAAEFVYEQLFERTIRPSVSGERARKGDKLANLAEAELRGLLDFIDESLIPDVPNYVVDALWAKADVLKDWPAITAMLLAEDEKLSDRQQLLLARLLHACIKRGAGKSICPTPKQDQDKEAAKQTPQHVESFSKHLTKTLPQLLSKYQAEADIVQELAELPLYMDIAVYVNSRQKNHFADLVRLLGELFLKHTQEETLQNIAATLKHLLSEEHSLKNVVHEAMSQLTNDLTKAFQENVANRSDEEAADNLMAVLTRVNALYSKVNLAQQLTFLEEVETLYTEAESQEEGEEGSETEQQIVVLALTITSTDLLWALTASAEASEEELDQLADKKNRFMASLEKLLRHPSSRVAEKAFLLLCDLLVVFPPALARTQFSKLAHTPSRHLTLALRQYFELQMSQLADAEGEKEVNEGEEGENAEEEKRPLSEGQVRKQQLLQAIARPITSGSLPASELAPLVLLHFADPNKVLHETLKLFLVKLRESGDSSPLILSALKKVYEEMVSKSGKEKEVAHQHFKELAQRLAQSYGIVVKQELLMELRHLVLAGVEYAFEQPLERFKFLGDGLNKMVPKLTSAIAEEIFERTKELERTHFGSEVDEQNLEHVPYLVFIDNLDRVAKARTAATPKRPTPGKKARAEKKAKKAGSEDGGESPKKRKKAATAGKKKEKTPSTEPKRRSPRKKSKKNYNEEDEVEPIDESGEEEEERAAPSEEEEEEVPLKKKNNNNKRKETAKKNSPKLQALYSDEEEEEEGEEDEAVLRAKLFG